MRERRQARIAELRRRFVESPALVMPDGGDGMSDSRRETVIPDAGTVYFWTYTMTGLWGRLDADKGVLITSANTVP